MGRILAIDYGRKRVGLAVTDEHQIIATALATVAASSAIGFLREYLLKNNVECFVIGEPKRFSNVPSEAERYIVPFLRILEKTFPGIRIERFDERFTSRIAERAIRESGIRKKRRQNKSLIDTVSATLILQSYLESRKI
jgi:putative Holliday junction resolvase